MSEPVPQRRGPKPKPPLKSGQIQGAKYLTQILDLLAPLHAQRPDPKRQLHYDHYCAWLLLYFFTPVLTSMRGLQQASGFEQIQRKLGLSRFSLGSFSEAGNVFDPQLLVPIVERIAARLDDIEPDARLRQLERRPMAVDGTLLHALPKMAWALWLDDDHHAAKMHLQFDLLRGAPDQATLTGANAGETRELERNLSPGRLYVADRGYFDYDLMNAIMAAQSSFLTRVHGNVAYDVLQEKPIGEADARAGVQLDALVSVGTKHHRQKIARTLRLVRVHATAPDAPAPRASLVDAKTQMPRQRKADYELVLLTDQLDLDVETIALLYRERWQVELFFRWFKKVLQADRPLALSEGGMTIVVYCALIASMLVVLWTGKKPTKRTFEMICFYFAGWVSDAELLAHLERLGSAETPNIA